MQQHRNLLMLILLPSLLLTAGCDESDVHAIRLELNGDQTGVLTVTSLESTDRATALESACSGVEFEARATLVQARGAVAKGAELRVSDIRFERGPSSLRVRIPRAAGRTWPSTLAPTDSAQWDRVQQTTGTKDLKRVIRLQITLPHEPTVHGFHPELEGVETSMEEDDGRWRCSLTLPLELAESRRDLIWDLLWRRE